MEGFLKKSLCVAALASVFGLMADNNCSKSVTLISPRSLGTDGALRVSADGVKQNLFGKECDGVWGTLSLAAGGGRTFRDGHIARCLFGPDITCNDNCASISIAGSCVTTRSANSWLADYFGLPTDYQSTVTFKPRVNRAFVDFNAYVGLDSCWEGLYFTLRVPFEHVRYELNMKETVIAAGTNPYDPGYFSEAQVPRTNLVDTFTDFVANGKVPNLSGIVDGFITNTTPVTSKVVFDPLACAKMYSCKEKTKNRVADLSASFGWNFFMDCDYHLGVYILASAPTGNRPCGEFLFEPLVGGGHHWNLGGGISGHVLLWQCDDEESQFGFYVDGSATHMFKAHQRRFFDLKNKPNSRYMLAEKMTRPSANLFSGTACGTGGVGNPNIAAATNVPSAQFANEFTSVANLTCCDVDVSVDVQGQVVAWFNYSTPCFSWDIGYEFWGRSCDKIKMNCNCPCPLDVTPSVWALKGDAHVFGFVNNPVQTGSGLTADQPIALSATESKATIHAGTNVPVGTTCSTAQPPTSLTDTRSNPNIDNAQCAFAGATTTATDLLMIEPGLAATTTGIGQQRTSFQPVLLTSDDVDICGAQSKGISHTVFTHISWTWNNYDRGDCCWSWAPYLGIGGKAEFAPGCNSSCDDNSCNTSCSTSTSSSTNCNTDCCDDNDCPRCNFSLWSVWLKGGISFD